MARSKHDQFAIGVDYGTNSVRALVVNVADGAEVGTHVYDYPSGDAGILLDPKAPNLARQNPADHTGHAEAAEITEKAAGHRDGYLKKCGGTYSSEWYWSKLLHCKRSAPKVF